MPDRHDPSWPAELELGIAERPLPGQARSGDRAVLAEFAGGALVAAIMALVILPTAALWAGAGGALAKVVDSPRARRIVNVSLATLLVASVATVWL